MPRAAFALVAVCVGLSFVAAQPPKAGKPAVTMDDIKKAWQERQDKVKTLKMSWKRVVVKPKGSMDRFVRRFNAPGVTVPQPPRDVRLFGEADFVLSDNRFRYECRRETWWMASQSAKPYRHTAILDGTSYLSSDSSVADPAKEQSAVQSPAQAYISVELLELKPVWWCVRGATGVLGDEPLSQFETDGRTVLHKGAACVLLEAKSRSANSSSQLLITRDGYLPVSYTRSVQGKPVTQLDIEYDRNSSPRLPIQWRAATRSPTGAAITESFEATVTSAEVGVAVPETAFKLTSPPGTIVVDTRQSDERKGPERVGVVLSDGTTSETVDRRGVKSYEELVAATRPRPARWPWIAAVVLATLAGAVGYWLAKRSQRTA